MAPLSISGQIREEVGSWPEVTVEEYGDGFIFFYVGRREIGHLHGSRMADLPFPVRIRERLVGAGRADLHHVHPKSGWISYYIRGEGDIRPVIELFRLNYSRPWLKAPSTSAASSLPATSRVPRLDRPPGLEDNPD